MAPPRLTPETLLSLPRPGAAVPSPSGAHYIQPYSHFDFDTGRTTRNLSIGKIPQQRSGSSSSVEEQGKHDTLPVIDLLKDLRYAEAVWLDDETVLYLRPRGAQAGIADVDTRLSDKAFKAKLAKDEDKLEGMDLWCKTLAGNSYKLGEVPVE